MKLAMACCSAAMPTLVLMPQYMQDKGCILAPEAVLDAVIIRCITLNVVLYYMLYYTTCCIILHVVLQGVLAAEDHTRAVGGEWKSPTYLI